MVDVPQGDRSPGRADPPATTISLRPRAWLESLHARRSAHLKHSRSYGERVILSVLLAGKQGRISTQGKHTYHRHPEKQPTRTWSRSSTVYKTLNRHSAA